jgi:hypothetical protein
MDFPLPLIEFAAFIGLVFYLFTMSSSPLRRDGAKSDDGTADDAHAEHRAPAEAGEAGKSKS